MRYQFLVILLCALFILPVQAEKLSCKAYVFDTKSSAEETDELKPFVLEIPKPTNVNSDETTFVQLKSPNSEKFLGSFKNMHLMVGVSVLIVDGTILKESLNLNLMGENSILSSLDLIGSATLAPLGETTLYYNFFDKGIVAYIECKR